MMVQAVSQLSALDMVQPMTQGQLRTEGTAAPGFAQTLQKAVESVNTTQMDARGALDGMSSGENVDLHGTMIALEKAEISLRLMASVRDKLVGAYEQVMNMAI
ncbi:MAG: flagellar hook-basal body complex protein FliE [Kiritimatiellia bacterium]|jgi:flagellar hook-basal body complex protein FliE